MPFCCCTEEQERLFWHSAGVRGGIAKKQMGRGWGGASVGRGGAVNKRAPCRAEPLRARLYGFPYLLLVLCRRGDRALHDWKFKQRTYFFFPFFFVCVFLFVCFSRIVKVVAVLFVAG